MSSKMFFFSFLTVCEDGVINAVLYIYQEGHPNRLNSDRPGTFPERLGTRALASETLR